MKETCQSFSHTDDNFKHLYDIVQVVNLKQIFLNYKKIVLFISKHARGMTKFLYHLYKNDIKQFLLCEETIQKYNRME